MILLPCADCGTLTRYRLCDECWRKTVRQTLDRHGPAVARREGADA